MEGNNGRLCNLCKHIRQSYNSKRMDALRSGQASEPSMEHCACCLRRSRGAARGEEDISTKDDENQEGNEQDPWKLDTESMTDEKSFPRQDTMPHLVAMVLAKDLDERIQSLETRRRPQSPSTERIHETIMTLSRELRNVKADVRSLKADARSLKANVRSLKGDIRSLKTERNHFQRNVNQGTYTSIQPSGH